jgi:hypothetical protein
VVTVNQESRDEIAASVAAHAELGPRYDDAVAAGLVERIGEEIDKRVDARLRGMGTRSGQPSPPSGQGAHAAQQGGPYGAPGGPPQQYYAPIPGALPVPGAPSPPAQPGAPAVPQRSGGPGGVVLGLGSMALGTGITASVISSTTASVAKVFIVLLIWAAIAVVNIAYSRRH